MKKTCGKCKYWERENISPEDMAKCVFLSGALTPDGEIYPESEETGIESIPICYHDGAGFTYYTKEWFGCVNFEKL